MATTYLTLDQLRERLQIGEYAAKTLLRSGELAFHMVGRHYRISEEDFEAYMARKRTPAAAEAVEDTTVGQPVARRRRRHGAS